MNTEKNKNNLKEILSAFMQVKPPSKKAEAKDKSERGRKGKRRKESKANG